MERSNESVIVQQSLGLQNLDSTGDEGRGMVGNTLEGRVDVGEGESGL